MYLSYKYRIYADSKQANETDGMLGAFCDLYNAALQERIAAYRATANARHELVWGTYKDKRGKLREGYVRCHLAAVENQNDSITYNNQAASLTAIRQDSFISQYSCAAEQQVLRRLDKAFNAFFSRLKKKGKAGFPRFRSKSRFDSAEFRIGNGLTISKSGKIRIVGISGELRVKWHRPLPAKPKSAVISRSNGKWYICFQVEIPDEEIQEPVNPVGIDVGLDRLAALSDGTTFDHPRYYKKSQAKRRRLQRALSRAKLHSKRRNKARIRLARHSASVANQRRDHAHKLTRNLIRTYDGFAFEDLQIKNMVKSNMSKSIHDAAWGQIIAFITYKAASAGMMCVAVDPRGTSQNCSGCGCIPLIKKNLSVRTHICDDCGLVLDRDVNAARNILQRSGLGSSLKALTGGGNKLVVLETPASAGGSS